MYAVADLCVCPRLGMNMSKKKGKSHGRWIIIGPGIIIALILTLQVAMRNHQTISPPPIIERQVIGGLETAEDAMPSLDIDYILKHAEQLGLSSRQTASLKKLQKEWETESKPLTKEMNEAADEFEQFMKKAGSKATMRDIQTHAARVSELSRQASSLRKIYWQKTLQVLNNDQVKKLQEEVSKEIRDRTSVEQEKTK